MICFYTQEMVKFSRYIVAKFFELLPKNPVLLAELVVWKSAGDCYEIVEGYGSLVLRYGMVSLHYLLCWAPLIYYWTWQRIFRPLLWKTLQFLALDSSCLLSQPHGVHSGFQRESRQKYVYYLDWCSWQIILVSTVSDQWRLVRKGSAAISREKPYATAQMTGWNT